jgi:hypothetical protein
MNSNFVASLRGASREDTLTKHFKTRPSASRLAAQNILPSADPAKSRLAHRGLQIGRKKKQEELTARLLMRPERSEVQKQGILLAGESHVAEKNPAYRGITNVRNSGPNEAQVAAFASGLREGDHSRPTFNVKKLGTKSRSQLEREAVADEYAQPPTPKPQPEPRQPQALTSHTGTTATTTRQ